MNKKDRDLILIVDDVEKNIEVLGNFLLNAGYDIQSAENAEEALEILKIDEAKLPELILLDVTMPGLNGFELCSILKKDNQLSLIPVIFLTAKTETDDIVKGFSVGGVDYITKPFNPRELLARVSTHVELIKSKKKIDSLNKELQRDGYLAGKVQQSLLPPMSFAMPSAKIAYAFEPFLNVGGDFIDYFYNPETNFLTILICDVSGHGLSAAMITAMLKITTSYHISKTNNPLELIQLIKETMSGIMADHFITAQISIIDLNSGTMSYVNAGHPPFLILRDNKELTFLRTPGLPIMDKLISNHDIEVLKIEKNDRILFYTDGVLETESEQNELNILSENEITSRYIQIHDTELNEIPEKLLRSIQKLHKKETFKDDVCILIFSYENS